MKAQETEFKGLPLLALYRSDADNYPLQFGVRKARLIVEHIDDIRAFVGRHEDAAAKQD